MMRKLAVAVAGLAVVLGLAACDNIPSGTVVYGNDVMPAPIAQDCYVYGYDTATCLAYAHQVWGWYPGKP